MPHNLLEIPPVGSNQADIGYQDDRRSVSVCSRQDSGPWVLHALASVGPLLWRLTQLAVFSVSVDSGSGKHTCTSRICTAGLRVSYNKCR